ncbi:unnamed protein product [Closterium sp. Yama58-4]|nr:unnamed protein product [Closterium sp. Yama58-4]
MVRVAIEAFLRGSSVVVCAPTSSGKTLVGEAAAAATMARGGRLIYTTPLKALSNQKLRDFRVKFGEGNVGLLTGDVAVNRDAPILVMTTEILRNMLYTRFSPHPPNPPFPSTPRFLIHPPLPYLQVIYCPKSIQLVCLSATVANPDELADWIGRVHGRTELVTSQHRPVPLKWHFSTRFRMLPLLDNRGRDINPGGGLAELVGRGRRGEAKSRVEELSAQQVQQQWRRQVPRVRDTLEQLRKKDMLPAIWFIFSRRGCDTAVSFVRDTNLLSPSEQAEVEAAIAALRQQQPEAVREGSVEALKKGVAAHHAGCLPPWKGFVEDLFQRGLVKVLKKGVAAHHAGCLPPWKGFVEDLFQRGLVKCSLFCPPPPSTHSTPHQVVFATETLSAGINMPARTTMLCALSSVPPSHAHTASHLSVPCSVPLPLPLTPLPIRWYSQQRPCQQASTCLHAPPCSLLSPNIWAVASVVAIRYPLVPTVHVHPCSFLLSTPLSHHRGNAGRSLLSANAMLQIGWRAGRRGKDRQGHVVVMQTPFHSPSLFPLIIFLFHSHRSVCRGNAVHSHLWHGSEPAGGECGWKCTETLSGMARGGGADAL